MNEGGVVWDDAERCALRKKSGRGVFEETKKSRMCVRKVKEYANGDKSVRFVC